MARALLSRLLAFAFVVTMIAGVLPAPAAGSPSQAGPLSTVVPFALPLLEGAQAKVELGHNVPGGNATSYWGNQPAFVNFSAWWWDSGAPTKSQLVLDGVPYVMSAAPGGDGDDSNGTLFDVKVNLTLLAAGDHQWYFDFTGPSGSARLPSTGNFTQLRLDTADRVLSDSLRNVANQIANAKRASPITMREVVNRTIAALDTMMSTDWDAVSGYTYVDANHYIITPAGATADNLEAFVSSTGASRARYTDVGTFVNNSQPAIKQALVLQGVLLATGLFNVSEIELRTETLTVNGTTYPHPFLRITLSDSSDLAGDGPVNGDGKMDGDLWGRGLPSPVAVGSHFGEDFVEANDALWDGSHEWPPVADAYSAYVLAPYRDVFNATAPDGTNLLFYTFESRPNASITTPVYYNSYWTDDPVVFDGLSSNQSAFLDLAYDWAVTNTVWTGFGPVWLQPITAVGLYQATLTVRDPFGQLDSTSVSFFMHGKTKARNPVSDIEFLEDNSRAIDLRVFFTDDDGFNTILFNFSQNPQGKILMNRTPASGPAVYYSAAPDWCGRGDAYINATDGVSPVVVQHFNISVTCVNDAPVVTGLPPAINFSEDGAYALTGLSTHATDADCCDTLTWSFSGASHVTGTYTAANDTLVFTAPPNWNGVDSGAISLTDGSVFVNTSIIITVLAANDPPYLNGTLGPFTVLEDAPDTTFFLTDYFVDPDGDPLAATVTAGPNLEAGYFAVLRQVWFHPAANFSGCSSFSVRVHDPYDAAATATVNVCVTEVNDPPVVLSVDPVGFASANESDLLVFTVTAFDSDSPTLTYTFDLDGEPQGASFLGTFEWQTGYLSAGRHNLNVTITDGAGGSASYHWSILIADRNRGPSVTIVRAGPLQYKTGETVHLRAEGTDPDGDNLTYSWTFGGALQPMQGQEIDVRFNSDGNYTVKVTASDGRLTATDSVVLRVVYVEPPPRPTNNSTPPPTSQPGFLSGFEAPAVLLSIAVGSAAFAFVSRRRR